MRAVTLKAAGAGVAQLVAYYESLAREQRNRDAPGRGPADYYVDPSEPPGRWWGSGCGAVGLAGDVQPEQLRALLEGRHPGTGKVLGRRFGLACETGCSATTLASFLRRHNHPARPSTDLPAGTTVILDEAGMAATDDLARLIRLADTKFWRLVCVGDPDQLPAVGRGGMFAHWCDTLPAHRLDHVHRFAERWQAAASLQLRHGDPAASQVYAAHQRLETIHPALLPARVARLHDTVEGRGESLAVTCASTATARAINLEIQRRRHTRRAGPAVELADGTEALVGDRIATRKNAPLVTDTGTLVRNRHTWTVTAAGHDGSLTVAEPDRGSVALSAGYVARHVELGWAVTGYGSQGTTTDHALCVVEAGSSRAGIYVGITRGRRHNRALIVDPTGLTAPQDAFAAAIAQPVNARTAHAIRDQLHRAAGVDPPGTVRRRV